MSYDPAKAARRIRTARRVAGYPTAADFARSIGVSPGRQQRLERQAFARMTPMLPMLAALCDRHGFSLDRLLCGIKPHPNSLVGRALQGDEAALTEIRAGGDRGALALAATIEQRLARRAVA